MIHQETVKHWCGTKIQNVYFQGQGHGQDHKVIDTIDFEKGFINRVCMPYMKSLFLNVQNIPYGKSLNFLTNTQTGQELDISEIHSVAYR